MEKRRNIKLTIEYDGTAYAGWQLQAEGRTIQGEIEEAILKLTGRKSRLIGSGRTDSGVHALGQVANFHTGTPLPRDTIRNGLNNYLPHDIRIMKAEDAAASFHARKDALEKVYEYTVINKEVASPLRGRYAYFFTYPLDIEAMKEGACHLVGVHDFREFATSKLTVKSTVRRITKCEIDRYDDEIVFRIAANGFLRYMVRYMAGTLLDIGRGKLAAGDVPVMLKGEMRAGPVAPPRGLCLMSVHY